MARTVTEIHQEILDAIAADAVLNAKLFSTSQTAIYRLYSYIIAVAIWMHEVLFDEHKAEVNDILATKFTHNAAWYVDKAKAFQFGDSLVVDKDYYDPIDEAKQIVTYAAVDELDGRLTMKVAKDDGDDLAPLVDPTELTPFTEYIFRVKDAGVAINIISTIGDDLKLNISIWYDPLVLDANGIRLDDGTTEPAKDTIKNHIKNIQFNGEFVPVNMVDDLQATEGIVIPEINSVQSRFGANPYADVVGKVKPNAGYLVIDDADLTINYIANV